MKKTSLMRGIVVVLILLFVLSADLSAQTAGTLSFSVTTTSSGGYSPDHFLAIWIENSSASFIKTKVRYTNSGDLDHMQTWVTKSGQNVVDAITGSTLTTHGTITFLWNGTNVAGSVVPDGSYFVWLEMAWASSLSTGKTVNSYPFTKGVSAFHSTPANTANFTSMVLDWIPSTTSVEDALENKDVIVYPNPSKGILNVNFRNSAKECQIQLISESGHIEYNEKLVGLDAGVKTFDLTGLPNGSYYCTLRFPEKTIIFSIILVK
jgi:hypothetical protein